MKKSQLSSLILTLIILIQSHEQTSAQDNIIQINITDKNAQPLFGISIQNNNSNYMFSFSDENGNGYVDSKLISNNDYIKISGIGYEPIILSVATLREHPNIELKEIQYDLPTVEVIHPTLESLLRKSEQQLNINRRSQNKTGQLSYYGNGYYTKIVESRDRVIHLRKEYGFFLTGGYSVISRNACLQFFFFPTLSARSMDLLCNKQDTLKKKVEYISGINDNIAYDATQRKIFESMEIIYRYTPLFASAKYFTFRWAEETSEYYSILFSTHTGIPSHVPTYKGQCKGTIYINKSDYKLQKIDINYFVRQFRIFASSAFKKIQATFAYTDNGICYIKDCSLETIWRFPASLKNKVTISELPVRPFAAKNQLTEKETWVCESYQPIRNIIEDKVTIRKINFLSKFIQAPYDSLKINFVPSSQEYNLKSLNDYMCLEKQYKENSMKLYWTEFDEENNRYSTYLYLKDFINKLKKDYYMKTK